MTTRIGINGFGRMGRLAVRALRQQPELRLVHVNETKGGVETAAHLLEFDTVHGRYPGAVSVDGGRLVFDGSPVTFSEATTPAAVPWNDHGVEVVIEATGKFTTAEAITVVPSPSVADAATVARGCTSEGQVTPAARQVS